MGTGVGSGARSWGAVGFADGLDAADVGYSLERRESVVSLWLA